MGHNNLDIHLSESLDKLPELTDFSELDGLLIDNICFNTVSLVNPDSTDTTSATPDVQSNKDIYNITETLNIDLSSIEELHILTALEGMSEDTHSNLTGVINEADFEVSQESIEQFTLKDNEFNDVHFDEVDKELSISMLQLHKYNDENELVIESDILIPIIKKGMEDVVNYIYNDVSADDIEIKENEFYVLPSCKPIKNVKFLTELMNSTGRFRSATEKIETINIMSSQLKSILEEKKIEREFFNMMLIN